MLQKFKYADLLDDDVFKRVFGRESTKVSELLKMDNVTRSKVLDKMTTERDLRNQMRYFKETALAEGMAEGMAKGLEEGMAKGVKEGHAVGRAETVRKMIAAGISVEAIANALGISVEECQAL